MFSAPAAVLVQHLHTGAGPGPDTTHRTLAAVTVYLAVTVAGLLVAPTLTGVAGRRRLRDGTLGVLVAALVALVVVSLRVHAPWPEPGRGWALVAFTLHVVAAATWIGGVVHLALFVAPDRRTGALVVGIRRFTRFAVSSAAALVGTGVALYAVHHLPLADLTNTAFGALVTGKALLLVVGALLGLAHRKAFTPSMLRRRPVLLRVEALTLGAALGLGSALAAVDGPLPPVQIIGAGLATVATDAEPSNVFVVSTSAQRAVVELLADESVALRDRTTGITTQLQPGQTTTVALSAGVARFELTNGDRPVRADIRAATPVTVRPSDIDTSDVSEWTAYQLGHVLAGPQSASPTAAASLGPFAEGRELGRLLRSRGLRQVAVVADGTTRASALTAGVNAAGVAISTGSQPASAVLVATSPTAGAAALKRLARQASPRTQAVYLAPWLLDGGVLSQSSVLRLPPITIATASAPMSTTADRFRIALASRAPGVEPTVAALRGYLDATDPTAAAGPIQLYAASPIGFLPGVLDEGHAHDGQGWFANGTLVPLDHL